MNIVIIGRTETLFDTAQLLHNKGYNIPLIITAKEAQEYKRTSNDFFEFANEIGADFLLTPKICQAVSTEIADKHKNLDIGISMNYTGILTKNFIEHCRLGVLNAHGGDLPKYRGNACQAWAILNGEKSIGLCIHKMIGDELDSGDIIEKDFFNLDINIKITEIFEWMNIKIPEMFLQAIKKLENNPDYILQKQSKNMSDILRCYPLKPEDGKITWNKTNIEILKRINAFNKPFEGAFCDYQSKKMTIWDAEIVDDNENYCAVEGQVSKIHSDGSVIVTCKNGKLKIKMVQFEHEIAPPGKWIKSLRNRLK